MNVGASVVTCVSDTKYSSSDPGGQPNCLKPSK